MITDVTFFTRRRLFSSQFWTHCYRFPNGRQHSVYFVSSRNRFPVTKRNIYTSGKQTILDEIQMRKRQMSTRTNGGNNINDFEDRPNTQNYNAEQRSEGEVHDHLKTHSNSGGNPQTHTHSHSDSHTHSHNDEHHSIFGHSHTHGHQPNELLMASSEIRDNPAVRITWIGLIVNVAMAVSKGVGGVYFHSQALVADAIHSLSDMVADFLTLATVNVANKIGSPTHFPLGYGKLETVGSLLVSGALLFAGISVGWSSLLQIFEYTLPSYIYEYVAMIHIGHSHSHTGLELNNASHHSHSHANLQGESESISHASQDSSKIPNINAAWLAGASILVKEFLFRKTLQVGNKTNSKVLIANAWHHRVDSLTSLVALITVTGGVLLNVAWLDSIGGLCVSILIIRAGWDTFKSSWWELVDRGEDASSEIFDTKKELLDNRLQSHFGDFRLTNLSVLTSGANTNILLSLSTPNKTKYTMEDFDNLQEDLTKVLKDNDKFIKHVIIEFKEVIS